MWRPVLWTFGLIFLWVSRLAAQDYDVRATDWRGLSELRQVASEVGVELRTPSRLDLRSVEKTDALLFVHPQVPLPRSALSEFMRGGGRVAVLDDLGTGDALLRTFGIQRYPIRLSPDALLLRGKRAWPIATPLAHHPLTKDVNALVTNHPAELAHAHLEALLRVGNGSPIALSGAVGAGRFVAVSDASVVINNMLEFHSNRRFAENLLRYLAEAGSGRIWLAATHTPVIGVPQPATPPKGGLTALGAGFRAMLDMPLPAEAVRVATWAIALMLLMAVIAALPVPSSYGRVHTFPASQRRRARNAVSEQRTAVLAYRTELVHALCASLRLPANATTPELLGALAEQGLNKDDLQRATQLLHSLDRVAEQSRSATAPPVSARRFRSVVAAGRSILDVVQRPSA